MELNTVSFIILFIKFFEYFNSASKDAQKYKSAFLFSSKGIFSIISKPSFIFESFVIKSKGYKPYLSISQRFITLYSCKVFLNRFIKISLVI